MQLHSALLGYPQCPALLVGGVQQCASYQSKQKRLDVVLLLVTLCRYGDSLHSGWRNILDIVIRLHKLNLLPPSVLIMESEDPEAAKQRLPRAPASRRVVSAGSMISRAFSRSSTSLLRNCMSALVMF